MWPFTRKDKRVKPVEPTRVELEIDRLHEKMSCLDPTDDAYRIIEARLDELYKVRDQDFETTKKKNKKDPIIPKEVQGPLVTGVFMLAGIGATKFLEIDGPITTKGWSFIPKGRV